MILNGLPVLESTLAVKLDGKQHNKKNWDRRDRYHRRIVKKWAKRYGPVIRVPAIFATPYALLVHPSLMAQLRADAKTDSILPV
jgi:hypothetical protein